jgi:TonB family protein
MANYTILLIDYEPRSIERFRDPLVAAGYRIEIATDGISGVEAFHRLNPDMVLVEAMIPKKHGFEVCQELKRTPHGRRTPVLITTSVYKGRKYRTQALHIYGCDEYIEKPIAAEQLLEIVGKFFGADVTPNSERPAEAESLSSDASGNRSSEITDAIGTQSAAPADPNSQKGQRKTPTVQAHPAVKTDGEDEITALLDAILPGSGAAPQPFESFPLPVVAPTESSAAATDDDPFAQIRAELNADMASFSGALAIDSAAYLEPESLPEVEFIPSDQAASPSVLDALPAPDAVAPGRVVNFDTKRSRKNIKKQKLDKPAVPPVAARVVEPSFSAPPVTLPRGTMVETELDSPKPRRGVPVWVWALVGIVAIAGAYLVFPRGAATPSETPASPPAQSSATESQPAAQAPSPVVEPPVAQAPVTQPPVTQPPVAQRPVSQSVTEGRKPATSTAKVAVQPPAPAPKKTPDRAAAQAANVKSKHAPADVPAVASAPTEIAPAIPSPTKPAPPTELGESVAGVETVPDSAVPSAAPAVTPGLLVPIDEADVLPVPISRQAPVYSAEARALQLSGTVIMNVLVNDRGTVDQVVLVTGIPGAGLNDSIMRAAKSWTYKPASKRGVPVKVWKSEKVVVAP